MNTAVQGMPCREANAERLLACPLELKMNDFTSLLAKFLPAAVIGALVAIFYLLDIFSVRPGMDNLTPAPARQTLEQVAAPAPGVSQQPPTVAPSSEPSPPATAVLEPTPAPPPVADAPPSAPSIVQQSAAPASPPAERVMNSTRHFMPPPGVGMPRPLASGSRPSEAPVELQTNEILQDNVEPMNDEPPIAGEQIEPPSPSGGGDG